MLPPGLRKVEPNVVAMDPAASGERAAQGTPDRAASGERAAQGTPTATGAGFKKDHELWGRAVRYETCGAR